MLSIPTLSLIGLDKAGRRSEKTKWEDEVGRVSEKTKWPTKVTTISSSPKHDTTPAETLTT
jgi:hypothetical protein